MDDDIGRRLKTIRTRMQLSQRQLARQSGVANATISQIEARKLNPTVSMLKKVLDGFPISLSEFFADEFEIRDRVFFRAEELTEIADGGVSYRQVGANLSERAIQFMQERYQPGSGTGKHAITHEGEECGIILRGRLEVTVGEQSAVLKKGDAYYFRSNQPHRFHNPGNEICELITACTPPTF
ncbi:MAG: cupin domain-containing protein [Proteobacteria bacterium]|nr:cupin domain-containing protein [Pseudomonadota bacterium]MCH8101398.1 cupin domain-containing protein [Pseudomonadota bacterium]